MMIGKSTKYALVLSTVLPNFLPNFLCANMQQVRQRARSVCDLVLTGVAYYSIEREIGTCLERY